MADKKDLTFQSPQELADILNGLGLVLHQRNRVTGESNYVWHVAELIRAAGRMCLKISDPSEPEDAFGNGYAPSKLSEEEQLDLLVDLLRTQLCKPRADNGRKSDNDTARKPADPFSL